MTDWANSTVLVTGGTGSFGRALIKKLLANTPPKKLIIFSRDECKQYEMQQEHTDRRLRFFLGDIRDKDRLYRAFDGVDIVIHAAALKQVPAAEYNPFEFVKTNVLGAANIIDAAIDRRVKKVIALSTDKAANPINLYGATKLCSDKLFVTANSYTGDRATQFGIVRYGNVIASRGSVIPLFMEMRKTGTLRLTDERMTRFWLTLDQGVDFVLSCVDQVQGGEIFVPKIASMKLMDLAKAIGPDCKFEFCGMRPGEKLHETLVPRDESPWCLEFDDRYVIQPSQLWWDAKGLIKRGGTPVAEGFRYRSDVNSNWLTGDALCKLIAKSEEEQAAQPKNPALR
ncbi:MAG: UDP-N-acetylglucosamine 4,6-dehydratase (inverting) [Cyanobacteria bacterium SZAS LIN-3]|nr:UDP-N-acetylglucosamine 4,6-dehydratase (inverting) [Cyanobacteria bacterium SZAS LIN-3]MBS2005662.1 UDP-N-acetylglucosamine 4,6-dehydratase (inverting) [Cyanobacteria bacterium SZAS TMP-1]